MWAREEHDEIEVDEVGVLLGVVLEARSLGDHSRDTGPTWDQETKCFLFIALVRKRAGAVGISC